MNPNKAYWGRQYFSLKPRAELILNVISRLYEEGPRHPQEKFSCVTLKFQVKHNGQ